MASFSFSLITLIVFETVDQLIIIPRYVLFFNREKKKKHLSKALINYRGVLPVLQLVSDHVGTEPLP